MSSSGYFKGEIPGTFDWVSDKYYTLDASTVNSLYFPRETDIITLSPYGESVKCWAEWRSSEKHWRIHISDFSFIGKVYFRLKSRAY